MVWVALGVPSKRPVLAAAPQPPSPEGRKGGKEKANRWGDAAQAALLVDYSGRFCCALFCAPVRQTDRRVLLDASSASSSSFSFSPPPTPPTTLATGSPPMLCSTYDKEVEEEKLPFHLFFRFRAEKSIIFDSGPKNRFRAEKLIYFFDSGPKKIELFFDSGPKNRFFFRFWAGKLMFRFWGQKLILFSIPGQKGSSPLPHPLSSSPHRQIGSAPTRLPARSAGRSLPFAITTSLFGMFRCHCNFNISASLFNYISFTIRPSKLARRSKLAF